MPIKYQTGPFSGVDFVRAKFRPIYAEDAVIT
jgi:hypothetical protein